MTFSATEAANGRDLLRRAGFTDAPGVSKIFESSTAALSAGLRGLRLLLYGFSGRGFPGGDGVAEAAERLPLLGVETVYSHALDPELPGKLSGTFDLVIACNTRITELLRAPQLWRTGERRALWFWDLRPGSVGASLRGLVHRVFLAYNGPWRSPTGALYDPAQWSSEVGCPVSYAPQGTSLREPVLDIGQHPRILFVGDLDNATYHSGRRELCRDIGATVLNRRKREDRLAVEARLPTLYRSARYVLSCSPLAPGYTSVRTYSILACGGCLVLHRFPGAERLFADGENAILFDTPTELNAKLDKLDADDGKRDAIADAGRALHASRDTVTHRVLRICREMLALQA